MNGKINIARQSEGESESESARARETDLQRGGSVGLQLVYSAVVAERVCSRSGTSFLGCKTIVNPASAHTVSLPTLDVTRTARARRRPAMHQLYGNLSPLKPFAASVPITLSAPIPAGAIE